MSELEIFCIKCSYPGPQLEDFRGKISFRCVRCGYHFPTAKTYQNRDEFEVRIWPKHESTLIN